MTKEQAVKNAQEAFIAALDVGVEEDSLIDGIFEAVTERELCLDAARMVNNIFEADSRWLTKMCEEELRQRETIECQNTRI